MLNLLFFYIFVKLYWKFKIFPTLIKSKKTCIGILNSLKIIHQKQKESQYALTLFKKFNEKQNTQKTIRSLDQAMLSLKIKENYVLKKQKKAKANENEKLIEMNNPNFWKKEIPLDQNLEDCSESIEMNLNNQYIYLDVAQYSQVIEKYSLQKFANIFENDQITIVKNIFIESEFIDFGKSACQQFTIFPKLSQKFENIQIIFPENDLNDAGIVYEIYNESSQNYWNIFILYSFVEIETLEKINFKNIFSHKISIQFQQNQSIEILNFPINYSILDYCIFQEIILKDQDNIIETEKKKTETEKQKQENQQEKILDQITQLLVNSKLDKSNQKIIGRFTFQQTESQNFVFKYYIFFSNNEMQIEIIEEEEKAETEKLKQYFLEVFQSFFAEKFK
eukprot:TRINITY_DN5026_c0_g2_i1.p1 TRINITY_DN5026_c0_g2~~TRINITY_DN5026_c0_g2_i1.p1  ORF type:complete len:393 (-),score=82.65 TRINITY_DN5026_c0_g2_i1:44-1222(-)